MRQITRLILILLVIAGYGQEARSYSCRATLSDWGRSIQQMPDDASNYFSPSIQIYNQFGISFLSCEETRSLLVYPGQCKTILDLRFCARAVPAGHHGNNTDIDPPSTGNGYIVSYNLYVPKSFKNSSSTGLSFCNALPAGRKLCTSITDTDCVPVCTASNLTCGTGAGQGPCSTSTAKPPLIATGLPTGGCCVNPMPRVQACGYYDACDGNDKSGCFLGQVGYEPYGYRDPAPDLTASKNLAAGAAALAVGGAAAYVLMDSPIGPGMLLAAGIMEGLSAGMKSMNWTVGNRNGNMTPADQEIACYEIPPAPLPPPFCTVLTPPPPAPRVETICAAGVTSTADNTCVPTFDNATSFQSNQSNLSASSFEHPLARVGFTNYVPICGSDLSTNCVKLVGIVSTDIHSKHNDLLPICNPKSGSSKTTDCVQFICPPTTTTCTAQSDGNYVRVVYSVHIAAANSNLPVITSWFDPSHLPSSSPLMVYGVNDANFYDLGYAFNKAYFSNSSSVPRIDQLQGNKETQQVNDTRRNINSRTFCSYIDPKNAGQLCIYEWDPVNNVCSPYDANHPSSPTNLTAPYKSPVGCVARPMMKQPIVASCDDNVTMICGATAQQTCNNANARSSFTDPKMVISLGSSANGTCQSGILATNTAANSTADPLPNGGYRYVYLHGRQFTTTVVDKDYKSCAFDSNGALLGSSQPTGTNIVTGTYTNGNYVGGIECKSDRSNVSQQYVRGASQICLQGYDTSVMAVSELIYIPTPTMPGCKVCTPNSWSNTTIPNCSTVSNACQQNFSTTSNAVSARLYPLYTEGSSPLITSGGGYVQGTSQICYPGRSTFCNDGGTCCDSCAGGTSCNTTQTIDLSHGVNVATEGVRQALPWELGLCVQVPGSTCPQTDKGSADGYASWLQSPAEYVAKLITDDATLTPIPCKKNSDGNCCDESYIPNPAGLPQRMCYPTGDTGTWDTSVTNPCSAPCQQTDAGESDGYASWQLTKSGQTATGTCDTNYAQSVGAPTRTCTNGTWGVVSNPCVLQTPCPAASNKNNITFEGSNASVSDFTCSSAYPGAKCEFSGSGSFFGGANSYYISYDIYWLCQNNGQWSQMQGNGCSIRLCSGDCTATNFTQCIPVPVQGSTSVQVLTPAN